MENPCVLTNRQCEYYPCHRTEAEAFNCLFCYCPLYFDPDCPGSPEYLPVRGGLLKDCSGCDFPHRPENYEKVVNRLAEVLFSERDRAGERSL